MHAEHEPAGSASQSPPSAALGVLDYDSHFQEPVTWLADVDPALARRCGGAALLAGTAAFVGVDVRDLPTTPFWETLVQWATGSSLAEAGTLAERDGTARYFSTDRFDAGDRLAWLDDTGIDHQVCNPTVAAHIVMGMATTEPELMPSVVAAYNQWAATVVEGSNRLHPTAMVDASKPMSRGSELRTMADAGSLTFLLPIDEGAWQRLGQPVAERFWAEVADVGVSPLLHLGVAATEQASPTGSVARWAGSQLQAQRCLLHWVASPFASRHPDITMLVEELGIDWAIPWLRTVERAESTPVLGWLGDSGERTRPLAEIARSQIAWVALPSDPIEEVLASDEAPRVLFGSDHPHAEGWGPDPITNARRRGMPV